MSMPSRDEIDDLVSALRRIAAISYEEKDGFHHLLHDNAYHAEYWTPVENTDAIWNIGNEPVHEVFQDSLKNLFRRAATDFAVSEFRIFGEGNSATVCKMMTQSGLPLAARLGFNDNLEKRLPIPYALQPYDRFDDGMLKMEILPLIRMIGTDALRQEFMPSPYGLDNDKPQVLSRVMRCLFDGACFADNDFLSDLGVLPDGTLVNADPGNVTLKTAGMRLAFRQAGISNQDSPAMRAINKSIATIRARIRILDLPDVFSPWTDNGSLKQDRFFPAP